MAGYPLSTPPRISVRLPAILKLLHNPNRHVTLLLYRFVQHLANDLFESHIQQAVEYYHLYTANRKLNKIETQELEKF